MLLVGAVTLSLSMLSQARCDGGQDRQVSAVHAASIVTAQHSSASSGRELNTGHDGHAGHGAGSKCGYDADGTSVHFDLNFNMAAVDLAPKERAPQALLAVVSIFTNLAPVPQDRPPKLFA